MNKRFTRNKNKTIKNGKQIVSQSGPFDRVRYIMGKTSDVKDTKRKYTIKLVFVIKTILLDGFFQKIDLYKCLNIFDTLSCLRFFNINKSLYILYSISLMT